MQHQIVPVWIDGQVGFVFAIEFVQRRYCGKTVLHYAEKQLKVLYDK
jgi:hypothetical protein